MVRILSYAFAALLLGTGAAFAESSPADDSGTELADTSIEDVSSGNLKIATALFDGQSGETADPPSDGKTATAWSMEDILQAKQDGQGWGQIFKQMKADGATDARNLGQLISGHNREGNGSLGAEDGGLANNIKKSKAGDSGDGDAFTSAASGGDSGSSADGPADGPEVKVGAYKELSPGGRKIVDSLFDNQSIGAEGNQAWSLDQIATAKQDGRGWGEIFRQMKTDGLTNARNLGQLVSGKHHLNQTAAATVGSSEITATKGSGRSSSAGGKGSSHAKASSAGGKHHIGSASRSGRSVGRGIVTAGGGATAGASAAAASGGGKGSGSGKSLGRGE